MNESCSKSKWESSERLPGSSADAVKIALKRHLCNFKMTLALLQFLQKSPTFPLSLCHIQ